MPFAFGFQIYPWAERVLRVRQYPAAAYGLALLLGYCWAAIRRVKRPVTRDLIRFHRREQMKKLRAIFRTLLRFKKLYNFSPLTQRS